MRKNALAMSIATLVGGLGFVGAASADVITNGTDPVTAGLKIGATNATQLQVNNGGVGHSLILPYFTTQNGNATIYSIVNTDTVNGKVVKVRHRGASNSDDILDFTVLMSPADIWTATLTAPTATSPSRLVTTDKTCTLPPIPAGGVDFITVRLTTKDTVNGVNANTREGYVEIFNMADIPPNAAAGSLFTAIKHVGGVPPCTDATIKTAILNTNHTTEASAAAQGLAGPTTGLFGGWTIINVPQTTTYSGEMAAIRALQADGVTDGRANFVVFPQNDTPYAPPVGVAADNVSADPLLRSTAFTSKSDVGVVAGIIGGPALQPLNFDLPDMSTPYTLIVGGTTATSPLDQAGKLTGSLAVKTITNEFATDPDIAGKDDWDISMPTRRYSVAMDYSQTTSRKLYSIVSEPVPGSTRQFFHDGNTSVNPLNTQQICVASTSQTFWNREEGAASGGGAVFSPGAAAAKASFCGETSVLSFRSPPPSPSALGGVIARQDTDASGFVNGWAAFNVVSSSGLGLPILSTNFFKATNPGVAAGFSGTFGVSTNARFTR